MSEHPYSELSPVALQALKAQSLAAAEMIDQAEQDLEERLKALRAMRKDVERSLEEIDDRLGVQPDVEVDPLDRVARGAATDAALRKKLLEKPDEALRDLGVEAPKGVKVTFVQDTPKLRHLVIPESPRATGRSTAPGGMQMEAPEGAQLEAPPRARPRRRRTTG
jgi:hypothetical protein